MAHTELVVTGTSLVETATPVHTDRHAAPPLFPETAVKRLALLLLLALPPCATAATGVATANTLAENAFEHPGKERENVDAEGMRSGIAHLAAPARRRE